MLPRHATTNGSGISGQDGGVEFTKARWDEEVLRVHEELERHRDQSILRRPEWRSGERRSEESSELSGSPQVFTTEGQVDSSLLELQRSTLREATGSELITPLVRPFTESGQLRIFDELVNPSELKWHWDEQDRFVTATHDTDWQFQFDNQLPQDMLKGLGFYIVSGTWHRLIKGTGSLTLEVIKHGL